MEGYDLVLLNVRSIKSSVLSIFFGGGEGEFFQFCRRALQPVIFIF